VARAHLLTTLAAVLGVALLALAWVLVWRTVRSQATLAIRKLWWIVGAWVAPFLFAAPFATQDVWTYGLEGHLVLNGFGGYRSASVLTHSVWTSGFDGTSIRPSPYGPGALDLSASFAWISGGHPWIAAECWRISAIIGLVLCAWGVHRIVSLAGGNATTATLAGVANPAVLIVLVGGIHNDAFMLGLTIAGVALALSGSPVQGMMFCALGVAIKSNALFAVGALAWWAWGTHWRQRAKGVLIAAGAVLGVLVVSGLGAGGGFGWLTALSSNRAIQGPWSMGATFFGAERSWPVPVIEITGLVLALALVMVQRKSGQWVVGLGWGFTALAVTASRPEAWYLAWGLLFLVAGGLTRRSERFGVLVLGAMMIGSVLPYAPLWWFSGVLLLLWLGLISLRSGQGLNDASERQRTPDDARVSASVPLT
jgi:hypothetical protein